MNWIKLSLAFMLLILSFGYGIGVGLYGWFPFDEIRIVKEIFVSFEYNSASPDNPFEIRSLNE